MFVTIVKAHVKPEKVSLYEETFKALQPKVLNNEPGVTFYELCRVPNSPCEYRVVECYVDQESQDLHLATDYYREAFAIIKDCLVDGAFELELVEVV